MAFIPAKPPVVWVRALAVRAFPPLRIHLFLALPFSYSCTRTRPNSIIYEEVFSHPPIPSVTHPQRLLRRSECSGVEWSVTACVRMRDPEGGRRKEGRGISLNGDAL